MSYRYVNRSTQTIYLNNKRGARHTFKPGEGTTDPWFSRFIGKNMLTKEAMDGTPVHASIPGPMPAPNARTNRKVRDSTIRVPPARSIDPHHPRSRGHTPQELLQQGCQVGCEHAQQAIVPAPHWNQIGSIFYCSYCAYFSLDGQAAIRQHIAVYHGIPIDQQTETLVATTAAPEVVASQAAVGITDTPLPAELPNPMNPAFGANESISQGYAPGKPVEIPAPVDVTPEIPAELPPAASPLTEPASPPTDSPAPNPEPPSGPAVCETCGKAFGGAHGLKIHKRKMHPNA